MQKIERIEVLVSETQLEAIQLFFGGEVEDILYGGAARWGKSEAIGIILAICIAAFPWSSWLIARTVLATLKATTLSTFFEVIKRFGYGEKSYRDKILNEKNIEFANRSKLYVLQVNYEISDPEYDRVGSYGFTGAFLDEWQEMSDKVREVLQGRLSELDGSFSTEVDMEFKDIDPEKMKVWYDVVFQVVGETTKPGDEPKKPRDSYLKEVIAGPMTCYITREVTLHIPYRLVKSEVIKNKLIHTYAWHFNGCIFTGCNPGTNFTKNAFYKPWKAGELPPHMAFIPAKVTDNPWVDEQYITRLERLPESSPRKQRLLYGNFDYDQDDTMLYTQQLLSQMFDKEYDWDKTGYMVVDAARMGKDNTEIGIWEWLHLKEIITIWEGDLTMQAEKIARIGAKHGISIENNTIVDEVGVGWGLVDMLWCKWFVGNSVALQPYSARYLKYKKRNYMNLRTQAFYYLQRYIPQIVITCNEDTKNDIIEELLTVKEVDITNDSKLQVVKKTLMKEELWRSPDKADMISMRMWFIIDEHHTNDESQEVDEVIYNEAEIEDQKLNSFLAWFNRPEKKEENEIEMWAF